MPNKVFQYFKDLAEGLRVWPSDQAPVPMPDNYKEVSGADLKENPTRMDSLLDCYQAVFGSGDIWGEGAVCQKCGKVVSLEQGQSSTSCECGGEYKPFFPDEELKARIFQELDEQEYKSPFCMVMENPEKREEVVGFCWGLIDTPAKIAQRIGKNRYQNDDVAGELVRGELESRFDADEEVLFIDELGVRKDARGGLGPVVFLTRMGFEKAHEAGVKKVLFWTARKSPIYKICRHSGYEDFFETPDGLVFLDLEDLTPFLTMIQNKSLMEDAVILSKAGALLK